jgi:hypothetical protein
MVHRLATFATLKTWVEFSEREGINVTEERLHVDRVSNTGMSQKEMLSASEAATERASKNLANALRVAATAGAAAAAAAAAGKE